LTQYVDLSTAEVIKYAHNTHGALEVIFANLLYDACERSAAQFEGVRNVVPLLGYVSRTLVSTYWNVHKDGKRGYAGACFPKDVSALAGWLGERGELLQGMERANARLRGEG
jgi:UDP-glucose 6-dehydrogenase